MSYDDDKFGAMFPRRTGVPTGHANERAMLDALGGSAGFRKRFRNEPDGSVTRLDTKNGQPQFSNSGPTVQAARTDIYMETGQLDWNYPADEAPDRLDPGKWHFIDIPTDDPFLGRIVSETGAQKNATALAEDQDSLAVGYPRSTDTGIDAATKDAYGASTLLKKFTIGFFPPSLYSGKMRLFLQAQYGAAETKTPAPLRIDFAGDSPVLTYVRNEVTLTFGLWAHDSPGIFTDDNGYFRLVMITNPTLAEYVVTVYPITAGASVSGLATYLRAHRSTLDTDTIAKLEAYIFAGSVIETTKPIAAGTFPAPAGGALIYGWKWNSTGSEASIVVHELLGTGAADLRWKARTIKVTLTSTGSGSAQTFTADHTTEAGAEWTDGWGTFNIFVPDSETSHSPLGLVSLKTDTGGVIADFNFTNVPVYGYYIEDVWTPVLMSRTVLTGPFPIHQWDDGGNVIYDPTFTTGYVSNRPGHGASFADEDVHYEERNITSGTTMTLSFNGQSYPGTSYAGEFINMDKVVTDAGFSVDNTVEFTGNVGGPEYSPTPPGYVFGGGGINHGGFAEVADITITTTTVNGRRFQAWILVIPGGDSEAIYVPTWDFDQPDSISTIHRTGQGVLYWFNPGPSPAPWNYTPYSNPEATNGFFGINGTDTVYTDSTPRPDFPFHIHCFNLPVHGTEGTPGGSLYSLFNVSRDYPFYDRGMYTYTSNGLRYIMSEGLQSPPSVTTARFVGWA